MKAAVTDIKSKYTGDSMNIKKLLLMLAATGLFAPLAGAADSPKKAEQTPVSPAKQAVPADKTKRPDLSFLNGTTGTVGGSVWSEEKLTAVMNARLGVKIKKFVYVDSVTSGLAMMKSGRADFMMTSDITAKYIIERNPDMSFVPITKNNSLAMLLRAPDVALRDSISAAITKLKASGKLAELRKKWIDELPVGKEPGMQNAEKTAFPETVRVGISGELPPFDYIAADGKPAGYNIAVLTEVSKLIGKNIEIVPVNALAKDIALATKKIDVFFWQRLPNSGEKEGLKGDPERQAFYTKFIYTEPYCTIDTVLLMNKPVKK